MTYEYVVTGNLDTSIIVTITVTANSLNEALNKARKEEPTLVVTNIVRTRVVEGKK